MLDCEGDIGEEIAQDFEGAFPDVSGAGLRLVAGEWGYVITAHCGAVSVDFRGHGLSPV